MSEETPKSGSNIPKSGAARPKRGLFGRLVMWLAVLAVIAVGGAAVTFDYWRPYAEPHFAAMLSELNIQAAAPSAPSVSLEPAAQDEQLSALAARVAALEQAQGAAGETAALQTRLETLEKALDDVRAMAAAAQLSGGKGGGKGGGGGEGETPAAVTETLTRINERLAELERAPSDTSLALRLEALESQAADGGQESRGALMVALGDLRAAMASGAPYKETLAVIAAVPGAAPKSAVSALQACAASGAPAAARLREDFRIAAREAARARVTAAEGGGWMDAVTAKAASLVSVRRIGETAPETLDGRLSAVERALEGGDIAAAVRAAEGVKGAPGRAVQPWLSDARMRLGCEQGLAALSSAAAAWFGGS